MVGEKDQVGFHGVEENQVKGCVVRALVRPNQGLPSETKHSQLPVLIRKPNYTIPLSSDHDTLAGRYCKRGERDSREGIGN